MSKFDGLETSVLGLIFNATAIANIAQNNASSPSTALWLSLHSADPGETGNQATSELSYTGYARVAVARTTGGWVVASGSVSPVSAISFPQATSTSTGTATYAAVGLSSAGAGTPLYKGALTPSINFGQNVTPQLSTASAITED